MLKAICQCAALQVEECPLVESVAVSQPVDATEDIPLFPCDRIMPVTGTNYISDNT